MKHFNLSPFQIYGIWQEQCPVQQPTQPPRQTNSFAAEVPVDYVYGKMTGAVILAFGAVMVMLRRCRHSGEMTRRESDAASG